jgi:hypothetical protein
MSGERAIDIMFGRGGDGVTWEYLVQARAWLDTNMPRAVAGLLQLLDAHRASTTGFISAHDHLYAETMNQYASGNTAGV